MNMLLIFIYLIATILTLFLLGFGLTLFITPLRLRPYTFWLIPWFSILFIIFSLVLFSLLGLSVHQASPIIITFLCLLNIIAIYKRKKHFILVKKEEAIIILIIFISILFNLSPLLKDQQLLTTVSMGNHDIVAYAQTGDYLINHSISESFYTKVPTGVYTLLLFGYRFGPPILTSFFLNIFNLEGYQFITIFQVILFSLILPLLYILFNLIYKQTLLGLLFVLIIAAFNVNFLYILYHDFFGQVLFWGIEIILVIFLLDYFYSKNINGRFNRYDFIIGLALSVLFFTYHEGAVFIILPLLVLLTVRTFFKKIDIRQLFPFVKIMGITFISSFFSIFHAINFLLFYRTNEIGGEIGWQLFRKNVPYANPFEMMGFYSIHSFEPLPLLLSLITSSLVLAIIGIGLLRSKNKLFIFSLITVYILFLFFSIIVARNFYLYNRMLTYGLPFFIILFGIGITEFFHKKNNIGKYVLVILMIVIIFNALKLNKRYLREYLVVDKSLISLKELNNNPLTKEPIYTESLLDASLPLWKQVWLEYFLYKDKSGPKTNAYINKKQASDNILVLISKPATITTPKLLLKNIAWENKYYQLGRLCNSNQCLMSRQENIDYIEIGKNQYEDNLLTSGWSIKESESRWAIGKESTLRLFTKKDNYKELNIEALTLKEPQEVSVYIDDQFIGKQKIKTNWQKYYYNIQKPLSVGVHNIVFKYTNTYRPIDLGLSQDMRELTVNFKKIQFK